LEDDIESFQLRDMIRRDLLPEWQAGVTSASRRGIPRFDCGF
jgi:hypothetical protein